METKTQQNARLFLKLLAPSRTGGLLTVVFAFFIVLAVMTPKFYEIANLDLYLGYIKEHPNGFYKQSLEASNAVNSSRFAADSSVFIVWGVAGLIGYSLIIGVVRLIKNTQDFIEDLEYSERRKRDIEREALIHTLLRVVAACSFFLVYTLLMQVILPLVVVVAQMALTATTLQATGLALAAVALMSVSLHLMIVVIRLALLRTRIFFT
ncbi:MAG TPA: hypothetical protein PL051_01030 [Candidatus Saccharibacteria bacterium]|nr:hypothetical protein [Candidatus Saccharibacteria bacterium]